MKNITKILQQHRVLIFLMLVKLFLPLPINGQEVIQSRGVDPQVRYQDLTRFGPWDDRNYQLTRADLDLLAPNEEELMDPIPVFFRVLLRKNNPRLLREGTAQYPRSALQIFQQEYGGYLVNNRMYSRVQLEDGRYKVLEQEAEVRAVGPSRFLEGEVRVTSPEGAAESAIKISPVDPDIIIAGSNGPGPEQRMHWSANGGETWTTVDLPLGDTCCDPTVDWSSDGSLAYAATLGDCTVFGLCSIWFYRSGDNGQTWTDLQNDTPGDPRRELTTGGSDKEYLHVDKHPRSPHRDNVYLTWHDFNDLQFARSTDNGNTWTTTSFSADPEGIGSDIVTDADGNIYYFWAATSAQEILLKRSTNGGVSFGAGTTQVATTNGDFIFPIPSIETRQAWIYVSADADLSTGPYGGSIYAAWTDTDGPDDEFDPENNHTRIQVAYSRDGGSTWTVVTPHETADIDSVDRWNQWLAVSPDGNVCVVFYDTRNSAGRSGVDLYYSVSTDGAQTFSSPERLTSETSPNLTDPFEFGDYNGLDYLARGIAIYTDNRQEGTGSGDSKDVYAVSKPSSEGTLGEKELPLHYTVKFVVGKSEGRILAPGNYFTAINVYNPEPKPVTLRKKFAIGLPGERSGGHTDFSEDVVTLGPGDALEIDTEDILARTQELCQSGFCKGFVVIESLAELDVVAVYTVADLNTEQVTTLHIDRVSPRCPIRTEVVSGPQVLFVPADVGGEDADPEYYGNGPCVDFRLTLEVEDEGRTLIAKYRMHAFECSDDFLAPKNDYTAAAGNDERVLIVASPRGRILGHDLNTGMKHRYIDTDHADDIFLFAAPNPVSQLRFVGDTSGEEAGTKTGVFISLRPITVKLETCAPAPPVIGGPKP